MMETFAESVAEKTKAMGVGVRRRCPAFDFNTHNATVGILDDQVNFGSAAVPEVP